LEIGSFSLHSFEVGGRHIVLLPKLNVAQLKFLREEFVERGFDPRTAPGPRSRGRGAVHILESGFCWASFDLVDAVAPLVPAMLDIGRQPVVLDDLRAKYFEAQHAAEGASVRIHARVEASWIWKELRASGAVGLTPDEREVVCFLIRHGGPCRLVTDFADDESSEGTRVGGRLYYSTLVDWDVAHSTLRSTGTWGRRNSYLPKSGVLTLRRWTPPSRGELKGLFSSLGDWCGFCSSRENSNSRPPGPPRPR
jgi:hypothetical protein